MSTQMEGLEKRNEILSDSLESQIAEKQKLLENQEALRQKIERLVTQVENLTEKVEHEQSELTDNSDANSNDLTSNNENHFAVNEKVSETGQGLLDESDLLRLRNFLSLGDLNELIYLRSLYMEKSNSENSYGESRSHSVERLGKESEKCSSPQSKKNDMTGSIGSTKQEKLLLAKIWNVIEKFRIGNKWLTELERVINKMMGNIMSDLRKDLGSMPELDVTVLLHLLAGLNNTSMAYLCGEDVQKINNTIFKLRKKIRKLPKDKIMRYKALLTKKEIEALQKEE